MAKEKEEEVKPEEGEQPPKPKKKLIIIIVIAVVGVLLIGGGGFFGYKMLTADKDGESGGDEKREITTDAVLVKFDPFILNLSDRGRYLKLAIQIELTDKRYDKDITANLPQLRDSIIMLISDKSAQSIATAEGKFQLKEEILYRVNHVIGIDKDVVTNIYFTDFVMQ